MVFRRIPALQLPEQLPSAVMTAAHFGSSHFGAYATYRPYRQQRAERIGPSGSPDRYQGQLDGAPHFATSPERGEIEFWVLYTSWNSLRPSFQSPVFNQYLVRITDILTVDWFYVARASWSASVPKRTERAVLPREILLSLALCPRWCAGRRTDLPTRYA